MNSLWTNKKNRLPVETVKAVIIVKVFFNKDCVEFRNLVEHNHSLLEKIVIWEVISQAKINDLVLFNVQF
jgi:hypothetical protein